MTSKKCKNKNHTITEPDFIKLVLFRFLCCEWEENFRNFVLVDRKRTKRFDDFVFLFDTDKDKTKYIALKLINHNVERNYCSIEDVINIFDLSHDIDRYLLTDDYLKSAKFEELIIFTNVEIKDYFVPLKEKKCNNVMSKRLLGRNVNLYKLNLDDTERILEIFYEQFLSQRKRLANELATYIMLHRQIDIQFLIKNDSLSFIKTFYLMLLEHVIDEENNQFKESFLSLSEMYETASLKEPLRHKELEEIEMIKKFREDFFESMVEFCQMYENKTVAELKHIFNFGNSQEEIEKTRELQQNLVSFHRDKNNYKEITKFLRSRKNLLVEISEEVVSCRLAKELALSVMLQKTFDVSSIIPSQKVIKKFQKFMNENVFEYNSKKLKETFLNNTSSDSETIITFRNCFYNNLKRLHRLCQDKDIKELKGIIINYCNPQQIDHNSVVYLHEILKKIKIEEKQFSDFLLSKEIRYRNSFDSNISSCFFPSGKVDNAAVCKKVLAFLSLIKFAVIKDHTSAFISREIKQIVGNKKNGPSICDGFSEFVKEWPQHNEILTVFQDFDSNFERRKWITKQDLVKNTCVLFQNEFVKFSDICSECEFIPPCSLFNVFNNDNVPSLGKGISKLHDSIYIPRTLTQSNKIDASTFFTTFSEDIVILTVGRKFSVSEFNRKYSLNIKFESLKFFNTWDSYFYTTCKFSYNFLEEFYNNKKEIVGDRSIHWITYLGNDLKYESSYKNESFINALDECKKKNYLTEDEIIKQRFVIITGDPGSGKTVLLDHVFNSLENVSKSAFYWFIMISLRECQKYLEKYSHLGVAENVIEFLSECENSTDEFSRNILSNFLNESRLIIYFDGFEDLHSTKNQQKVKDLFKVLSYSNVKQLWISTTPPYVEELEYTLGVISCKIEGLSEAEQIKLIAYLWKVSHDDSLSVNDYYPKSKILIESFTNSCKSQRNLLALPLYTHVLAVTFMDETDNETSFNCEDVDLVELCKNHLIEEEEKSLYTKRVEEMKLVNAEWGKTKKELKNADRNYEMKTFDFYFQIIKLKDKIRQRRKWRKLKWIKGRERRRTKKKFKFKNRDKHNVKSLNRKYAKMKLQHTRRMKMKKLSKSTNNFYAYSFSIYEESKIGYYERKGKKKLKATLKKLSTSLNSNATIRWNKPSRKNRYENKIKVSMDTNIKTRSINKNKIKEVSMDTNKKKTRIKKYKKKIKVSMDADKCADAERLNVIRDLDKFYTGFPLLKKRNIDSELPISRQKKKKKKKKKKSFPKDKKEEYVNKVKTKEESFPIIERQKKEKKKLIYVLKIENKSFMNW